MHKRLYYYAQLMRLHRPIGILLFLWPTLWALWIASNGRPNLIILTIFVLGVIIMRSAGCVINDIADRNFDGHVTRTKDRPLASGKITLTEAILVFIALIIVAFGLVLLLNPLTIALSFGVVASAMLYPFMKRYTHWPQVFLGIACTWGVPMAFAAQQNTVPGIAWFLFGIAALWPIAYDTMYAMVDRPDDIKIGIKSTAILFGQADKFIIAILQLIILTLLALLGVVLHFSMGYFVALCLALILAAYQQYLLHNREPANCFKAFLNNQWFGLVIFAGIVINYL